MNVLIIFSKHVNGRHVTANALLPCIALITSVLEFKVFGPNGGLTIVCFVLFTSKCRKHFRHSRKAKAHDSWM